MKNIKILVLASTFPRWGNDSTPPFVYELSKQYTKEAEVVVLAPFSKGSKKYEVMDGMKVHRFNYWPFAKKLADGAILPNLKTNKLFWLQVPFFFLFEFLAAWKMMRIYKPTVIHAHWIIPQGIVAVVLKKLLGWNGKIVCTTHGGDIFGLQFINNVKKWVVKNCSALTVVSEAIKDKIDSFGLATPVSVIPMGVDTAKFNKSKADSSLREKYGIKGEFLLFVGRLSEKKGVEYLIKAMPEVLSKHPDAKLLIVGNGELETKLKKLVNDKLKISNNVIFAGGIPNSELPKYYATADIFIGPSVIAEGGDREGFPVSFMEAMACETPLIISDIEIFAPLIRNKNGLKAKEKSTSELAACIIMLIEDNALSDKIIKCNSQLIQNVFSLDKIGERYLSVLYS